MSSIYSDATTDSDYTGRKSLILLDNKHGIGIDLGWRLVTDKPGIHATIVQWGNTKNEDTLRRFIVNCRISKKEQDRFDDVIDRRLGDVPMDEKSVLMRDNFDRIKDLIQGAMKGDQ
jgi:hypothetical protein